MCVSSPYPSVVKTGLRSSLFGGQRVYVVPSADLVFARAGEVDLAYDDSVIVNALLRGLQRAEVAAARVAYDSDPADAVRAPAPGLGGPQAR